MNGMYWFWMYTVIVKAIPGKLARTDTFQCYRLASVFDLLISRSAPNIPALP